MTAGLLLLLLANTTSHGATVIVSDNYTATTSGTGFALNAGVNTGINPPTTRMTGTAAGGLRYLQTVTTRPAASYDINNNRVRVTADVTIGRYTLSANGSSPFDFGPALGTAYATPANPISYDVKISMRNDATASARFSFGLATVEGDINNMDFAVQMYRANTGDNFYTIQKRIDRGSFNGLTSIDGTGDLNAVMMTTGPGTNNTLVDFLIRVTDAGAESGVDYHSRIQVSLNNGSTWVYDTATDAALPNGFRFDATGRFIAFDQAGNTTGSVYYDAFSINWNSGPRTWSGAGANGNWSNATNWGGATPINGSALTFSGTARLINTNDLTGLQSPWLKFSAGGFALWGNAVTLSSALTNTTGNNTINAGITLSGPLNLQSEAGTLTLAGGITAGANQLSVNGAGNTTVSSAITGSGGVTKDGAGTLSFSGSTANTYLGSTLVNAGTLSLAKSPGINAVPGNVTVGDGSGSDVLLLNAANQIPDTAIVTLSSSGVFDLNGFDETVASVSSSGSASQVALGAATFTTGDANPSTFAGTITGAGNIVKQGAGTLTLIGASTFSGTATINAGAVNIQNATALGSTGSTIVNSGAALEIQGGISISGEALTLNGSGTTSSGALRNVSGNNSWSGALNLGSATRIHSDTGTLTIGGALTGAQGLTIGGAGNTTISSAITSGSLTKEGTGLLQLSGPSANSYSGATIINSGTLSLAKTANIDAISTSVTIGDGLGGAGADVLRLNAADQIPDAATVTITASGIFDLNGFSETVAAISSSTAASQIALGAATLTIDSPTASTFAGAISGTGSLLKRGLGTLTLSGANSYSGTTTVDVGKLAVGAGGSIASSTTYAISSGATIDVSAIVFAVDNGETLACKSSTGDADLIGDVTLSSGADFSTQASGTAGTSGKLAITGNLTLNTNTVNINVVGGPLDVGTYSLISFTGTRVGSFATTPNITGSGLGTGLAAKIVQSSGFISLNVYNPTAANTLFKVMTYNMHFGTDSNGVVDTTDTANFIVNQNVDLVALNEVARNMPRVNGRDLIAELSAKTGMAYVFSNNDTSLTGNDQFGNAILSRFPILFRDHRLLPRVGSNEQRGWLKAIVDVKGKFVSFWVSHLDFHADDTERLMAVTNFNTWVGDEVFPTILCGDFNETPDKNVHPKMETKWDDIWSVSGDGTLGRTVPCPGPLTARIDYIWKQQGAPLISTNTVVDYNLEESDHFPIRSKFILTITTNHASGFYLRFDEGSGTNVTDSVGGLKGTMGTGAPVWSTNAPSGMAGDFSLFFNGSKTLTIPDTKQIIGTNGVNDSYTLQAWVKVAVNYAPAQRAIMFQYDRRPGFSFSINTNRTLHTTAFKVLDIPSGATLPNDGQWHHVAVVHTDGANMKFYIDATLAATVAYTNGSGYRTSSAITIGSDPDGANPFTGYLARVKFDSRALTASQLDYPAVPPAQRSSAPEAGPDFSTWQSDNGITDASGDDDSDGQSNYAEFVAGTNPNDSNSALRITQAKADAGKSVLTWTSVGGKRYRVQYTDDLVKPFSDLVRDAATETAPASRGIEGTQSFTDTESTNTARYYRVKVIAN
jgi:autotransporter-associated beta strand protein